MAEIELVAVTIVTVVGRSAMCSMLLNLAQTDFAA